MAILSIKVRLGDRDYSMKVDESEEETLRAAGRLLNEKIKKFKEDYHIEDKQDLLAMIAFDSMVEHMKKQNETENEHALFDAKLTYLNNLITKSLTDS
ncbi:MAG: cell division protein ZapA [Cytophagales bacterium]|nr:cell division protein ZapA [Cytophagales bacterium]